MNVPMLVITLDVEEQGKNAGTKSAIGLMSAPENHAAVVGQVVYGSHLIAIYQVCINS